MKLPQLYVRDLFWLVLVCALGVGWWVERRAIALREEAVRKHEARLAALETEMTNDMESILQKLTDELNTRRTELGLPKLPPEEFFSEEFYEQEVSGPLTFGPAK